MWLLIVEALIALCMLGFIVWWTMFAGRHKGEVRGDAKDAADKPDEPPR